ncbi:hypothetical protein [uncultured Desulfovibrio sp.]|mgnify:CR=1 FL=1|uniref:hypothetical protein n=1 Tax=uncultured Desulfovibrio sp. TaxID=167968 RepID=UPI0003A12A39|nr:hypothetical protein [uncultured Desulfovibrio sp.]
MRRVLPLLVLCAALCAEADGSGPAPRAVLAASALSSRHSGLEPPGGPKPLEGLPPASAPSRTTEGGMGYTDAYGNTIEDRPPEEKAPRKRLRSGAHGPYGSGEDSRPLPDPDAKPENPAWSFK